MKVTKVILRNENGDFIESHLESFDSIAVAIWSACNLCAFQETSERCSRMTFASYADVLLENDEYRSYEITNDYINTLKYKRIW